MVGAGNARFPIETGSRRLSRTPGAHRSAQPTGYRQRRCPAPDLGRNRGAGRGPGRRAARNGAARGRHRGGAVAQYRGTGPGLSRAGAARRHRQPGARAVRAARTEEDPVGALRTRLSVARFTQGPGSARRACRCLPGLPALQHGIALGRQCHRHRHLSAEHRATGSLAGLSAGVRARSQRHFHHLLDLGHNRHAQGRSAQRESVAGDQPGKRRPGRVAGWRCAVEPVSHGQHGWPRGVLFQLADLPGNPGSSPPVGPRGISAPASGREDQLHHRAAGPAQHAAARGANAGRHRSRSPAGDRQRQRAARALDDPRLRRKARHRDTQQFRV